MGSQSIDPYLPVAEVASALGMSTGGVYKLIQRGKLPAVRLSERGTRVARWALDAYVDSLNGRGPDSTLRVDALDPERLRAEFEAEAGSSPEAWIAAWKRDEIEDSAENTRRLVQALALREHHGKSLVTAGEPWATAALSIRSGASP